ERNPKEIASYVNRGEVYLRQGKILEAAQDFKKAVDLDPENKDPLSHRARILAAAALETLEAATKEAQKKGLVGKEGGRIMVDPSKFEDDEPKSASGGAPKGKAPAKSEAKGGHKPAPAKGGSSKKK